jgi:hypothetical protein
VHASSLEQGGVAEDDLAQFEITDPHTSRFWQIRTGQFDKGFARLIDEKIAVIKKQTSGKQPAPGNPE